MDKSGTYDTEQLILTANQIKNTIARRGYQNALMELIGEQPNPFKGMCYVASALLYELFDGKNMTLYRKKDFLMQYHWWIKTDDGTTIDITADQYELEGRETPSVSYDGAEIAKLMWFPSYKKRIAVLKKELEEYQVLVFNPKK